MNKPVIGITTDLDDKYLRVKHGYCEAIAINWGIPVLIPPVNDPRVYADMIDGLLIPGGDDVAPSYYGETMSPGVRPASRRRSDFEISILSEVVDLRKPVLGICYGMQLINVAFKGTLYQDIDTVAVNHKKDNHTVTVNENRFLSAGTFSINSTHHQAVKKLGDGLWAFAFSSDGLIEAFYKEDYNFLIGIQWHPERIMENKLSLDLFRNFIKATSDGK